MIDRYGAGPNLVIALHGSPANRKAWLPLSRLLPGNVALLAPDLPGHGARAGEPFTIEETLAQLETTIALVRAGSASEPPPERIVVAGDSLGGYLAMAAGAHLAGIDAVVAGGCTFEMRGLASTLARASDVPLTLALRLFGARRVTRALDLILPKLIGAGDAREVSAAGLRLEARGESIRALSHVVTSDLVRSCQAPIVFVNGSRDWPTRAYEKRFLRIAPRAELLLAEGSPHGVSQFAPAVFASAIERAIAIAGG